MLSANKRSLYSLLHYNVLNLGGGCVEFRGNGEFLRRSLLLEMGAEKAWNEFSLTGTEVESIFL